MNCIVTAGPTYEPLDDVRRLTNFSTGRLGSELADYLASQDHEVTLLIGQMAKWHASSKARHVVTFGTTANLRDHLNSLAHPSIDAVFHAAAVSDFAFGKIWTRSDQGAMSEVHAGKISTRLGTLLVELTPTAKLISELRDRYPGAMLVGWKYEVEGDRTAVLRAAQQQILACRTNFCIANGPGYGSGFGLVAPDGSCQHLARSEALYQALERLLRRKVADQG